jgi:hypothetical protein
METAVAGYYGINSLETHGGRLDIAAFGGPLGILWDEDAKVTRWGGLSYFATFLKVSRMFDRLVEDAPFVYTSPNAPRCATWSARWCWRSWPGSGGTAI